MKYNWRIQFIIIFITVTLLISGCQETPSQNVVKPKGDESIVYETIEHAQRQTKEETIDKISVPEKWFYCNDEYSDFVINYEADVIMPELEKYPIREVFPSRFSQEMVDKYVDYFADERDIFVWEAEATKEDRERELIDYLRGAEVDGTIVKPEPDDPYINELLEKIRRAPDAENRQSANTALQPSENDGEYLKLGVDWGNGEDALITVSNFENGTYDSVFVFSRGGNIFSEHDAVLNGKELKEISFSKEEAISVADTTLSNLGISDMVVSSICRADFQPWEHGSLSGLRSTYESSGYIVTYTRNCDGLSVIDTSDNGTYSISDTSTSAYLPIYSAPWHQEMIKVYVDEKGVSRFSWNGYEQVGSILVDDVQLMGFEELMEQADKQLFYQNGGELLYAEQIKIKVDRIELGWALINKRNEPGKGLLVPAWYYFYDKESKYEGSEEIYHVNGILVLNALDSSVINPLPTS